jgi:hypothetical protein
MEEQYSSPQPTKENYMSNATEGKLIISILRKMHDNMPDAGTRTLILRQIKLQENIMDLGKDIEELDVGIKNNGKLPVPSSILLKDLITNWTDMAERMKILMEELLQLQKLLLNQVLSLKPTERQFMMQCLAALGQVS